MAKTMKPKMMPKAQPKKMPAMKQPMPKAGGLGKDKGYKSGKC